MPETALDTREIVEQALRDGDIYRLLLDQMEEGIYITDRDRRILYWNGGAERISGYYSHEIVGRLCQGDLLMHCDESGQLLSGTFLGILLCYGLLGPMASRMGKAADEEGHFYHVVRVAVISFLKGTSPLIAIEFARRAVPGHVRPSFQELENACKGKGPPAAASEAPAAEAPAAAA
jgi:hypothetical protein